MISDYGDVRRRDWMKNLHSQINRVHFFLIQTAQFCSVRGENWVFFSLRIVFFYRLFVCPPWRNFWYSRNLENLFHLSQVNNWKWFKTVKVDKDLSGFNRANTDNVINAKSMNKFEFVIKKKNSCSLQSQWDFTVSIIFDAKYFWYLQADKGRRF